MYIYIYGADVVEWSRALDVRPSECDAVYQWCEFKSRRGKNKNLRSHKSNSNTVWFNFQTYTYIYIKKSNEIRMLVHIKEISKKKNKTYFSQHSCTNVFTAVADLQV